MLDPRQLAVLQEVARLGSYSAAARSLGFTQPAITYQMRCLERDVGATLAVRTGRVMVLTDAGQALLGHAEQVLAALRAAEDDMRHRRENGVARVRLAAFPSICATLVPSALAALRRSQPGIAIDLMQAEPTESRALIRGGRADLALSYRFESVGDDPPPPDMAGLTATPVFSEPVHLILPMDHPVAARRVIDIGQLRDDTFIVASPRFDQILRRLAAAAGFEPRTQMAADDYVVLQAMAASGFGVTLIPDLAVRAHRDPRVVSRSLNGWPQRHVQIETWPEMLRVDAVRAVATQILASAGASAAPVSPA